MRGPGHYDPLRDAEEKARLDRREEAKQDFADGADATTKRQLVGPADLRQPESSEMHIPSAPAVESSPEADMLTDPERWDAVYSAFRDQLIHSAETGRIRSWEIASELQRFGHGDPFATERAEAAYAASLASDTANDKPVDENAVVADFPLLSVAEPENGDANDSVQIDIPDTEIDHANALDREVEDDVVLDEGYDLGGDDHGDDDQEFTSDRKPDETSQDSSVEMTDAQQARLNRLLHQIYREAAREVTEHDNGPNGPDLSGGHGRGRT